MYIHTQIYFTSYVHNISVIIVVYRFCMNCRTQCYQVTYTSYMVVVPPVATGWSQYHNMKRQSRDERTCVWKVVDEWVLCFWCRRWQALQDGALKNRRVVPLKYTHYLSYSSCYPHDFTMVVLFTQLIWMVCFSHNWLNSRFNINHTCRVYLSQVLILLYDRKVVQYALWRWEQYRYIQHELLVKTLWCCKSIPCSLIKTHTHISLTVHSKELAGTKWAIKPSPSHCLIYLSRELLNVHNSTW